MKAAGAARATRSHHSTSTWAGVRGSVRGWCRRPAPRDTLWCSRNVDVAAAACRGGTGLSDALVTGPWMRSRPITHVDCPPRAPATVHLRGARPRHPDARPADDPAYARRHLPRHRHPGRRRHLELQRPQRRGDDGPDDLGLRTLAHHHRQRHRAHRVADDARDLGGEDLLPAQRAHRDVGRPGDGRLAIAAAHDAPGHQPAVHHGLQRGNRAGIDAGPLGHEPVRAAALRPGRELPARAAGHRAGRVDPAAVRRQAAANPGGSRPGGPAGQGPGAARRRQRDRGAEPDPARRNGEDRRPGARRRHQRQPEDG